MADKKDQTPVLERTYNVPLRKEYQKAPRWKRTEKAVVGLRQFLGKHMKSEKVLLSTSLNNELWKHGIKNPPHHIKVTATKNKEGIVHAQLFGVKEEKKKEVKKEEIKEETQNEQAVEALKEVAKPAKARKTKASEQEQK